jgi:nucleotide-binding universal stress UspA family protein
MGELKKVLCPVDLAAHTHSPAEQAASLAKALGAELVLLHVLGDPTFAISDPMLGPAELTSYGLPALADEYREEMGARLNRLGNRVRALGVPVSTMLVQGTTHEAIVNAADAEHADLIVMSTHGRKGLSHLLLGSVTERVVRTAKVPVMTLRVH